MTYICIQVIFFRKFIKYNGKAKIRRLLPYLFTNCFIIYETDISAITCDEKNRFGRITKQQHIAINVFPSVNKEYTVKNDNIVSKKDISWYRVFLKCRGKGTQS